MKRWLTAGLALLLSSSVLYALSEMEVGMPRSPGDFYNWRAVQDNFDATEDQLILVTISDLSVKTSSFAIAPEACRIVEWRSVVEAEVVAATVLKLYIAKNGPDSGIPIGFAALPRDDSNVITIAAASVAGTIDSFTGVSTNNSVDAGDLIAVESDGASSAQAAAKITIVCRR